MGEHSLPSAARRFRMGEEFDHLVDVEGFDLHDRGAGQHHAGSGDGLRVFAGATSHHQRIPGSGVTVQALYRRGVPVGGQLVQTVEHRQDAAFGQQFLSWVLLVPCRAGQAPVLIAQPPRDEHLDVFGVGVPIGDRQQDGDRFAFNGMLDEPQGQEQCQDALTRAGLPEHHELPVRQLPELDDDFLGVALQRYLPPMGIRQVQHRFAGGRDRKAGRRPANPQRRRLAHPPEHRFVFPLPSHRLRQFGRRGLHHGGMVGRRRTGLNELGRHGDDDEYAGQSPGQRGPPPRFHLHGAGRQIPHQPDSDRDRRERERRHGPTTSAQTAHVRQHHGRHRREQRRKGDTSVRGGSATGHQFGLDLPRGRRNGRGIRLSPRRAMRFSRFRVRPRSGWVG